MSDVTMKEIDDALDRAQALKGIAEEFISIADAINNAERIRLEDVRGIDIDSKRWVPLEDYPLGEEVLRVKGDMPGLETAIQSLEDLANAEIQMLMLLKNSKTLWKTWIPSKTRFRMSAQKKLLRSLRRLTTTTYIMNKMTQNTVMRRMNNGYSDPLAL